MKTPQTVSRLRANLSDSPYVTALIYQITHAKKSRKRKEYLRALIRVANERQEDDFIYFSGNDADELLHARKSLYKKS